MQHDKVYWEARLINFFPCCTDVALGPQDLLSCWGWKSHSSGGDGSTPAIFHAQQEHSGLLSYRLWWLSLESLGNRYFTAHLLQDLQIRRSWSFTFIKEILTLTLGNVRGCEDGHNYECCTNRCLYTFFFEMVKALHDISRLLIILHCAHSSLTLSWVV